jgi:hypothetical protein
MARRTSGDALDTDNDTDMDLVFTSDEDEERPRGLRPGLAVSGPVRVRVEAPFQVVQNTVVYRPGEVVEVDASVAADWVRDGWVSPAE